MSQYIVKEGQSLIDIACEVYGAAEMVVKLAQDNDLTITEDIPGRFVLTYDETVTALVDSAAYFRLNNLNIVSADLNDDGDDLLEHSKEEHTKQEHN